MKHLFLFAISTILLSATFPHQSEKGKIYYFCTSRAFDQKNITGKQVFQYTEIKTMADDKDSIRKRMYEWGNLAHSHCENKSGCNADMNHYDTYEEAKKEFDFEIKEASDTSRFLLRKREF